MSSADLIKEIPLLLTSSAVAHDTSVRLNATDDRIRLTLESVAEWLAIDPRIPIVICDGSGFDFSELLERQFPMARIECIAFENDPAAVRKIGRGYGEGEIVRYALSHSRLIKEAGCFAKCTAKLWIQNYRHCLLEWNRNQNLLLKGVFSNVFSPLRATAFSYVDTRFYISTITTYKAYFENAHFEIDSSAGQSLEECFRDIILRNALHASLFRVPPVICGVGGGTGVNRPGIGRHL